jgi:hypothetical protein
MNSDKVVKLPVDARHAAASPALPQVSQFERLERRLTAALAASGELKVAMSNTSEAGVERLSAAIESAERLVTLGEVGALRHEIVDALAPATVEEIAARVGVLIKAIPNHGKEDLEIYGRLLAEDVGAQGPSRLGLEIGCRRLRRTSKWLPAISEMLAELSKTEAGIKHAPRSLEELPELIAQARDRFVKELRRREQYDDATRMDMQARFQTFSADLRERDRTRQRAPQCGVRQAPASLPDAKAAALAGVHGAAESAPLSAREAMAKHRAELGDGTSEADAPSSDSCWFNE